MEALTRLVTESLARHGLDRPVDPRRLQWSRWFRCDSTHSLLIVPSKPGIFALAEEITSGETPASPVNREAQDSRRSAVGTNVPPTLADEKEKIGSGGEAKVVKRMLAVIQFAEDDDMAFTLDRMFTCVNPMRTRLGSGRCFLRFVVIEDQEQRRSICTALNQWMLASAGKAAGLPTDFSSSLEFTSAEVSPSRAVASAQFEAAPAISAVAASHLHSSPAIHHESFLQLPSGF